MKYKYKATFDKKKYPEAFGEIEATSPQEAEEILFGCCGEWADKNGNSFSAGCPADVEILSKRGPKYKFGKSRSVPVRIAEAWLNLIEGNRSEYIQIAVKEKLERDGLLEEVKG